MAPTRKCPCTSVFVLSVILCLVATTIGSEKNSSVQYFQQAVLLPYINRLLQDYPTTCAHVLALLNNASIVANEMSISGTHVSNAANETSTEATRSNFKTNETSFGANQQLVSGLNNLHFPTNWTSNVDLLQMLTQTILAATHGQVSNLTVNCLMSLLGTVNPLVAIQRLLGSRSARDVIPHVPAISERCYNDLTDSLDAFAAAKGWAFDMFDAQGKPLAGIKNGAFYFVGSFDQCYRITPHISQGEILGNVSQRESRDFGTRYCRADFAIPKDLVDALHVNTHGVHLKLTWGLCVPDTCDKANIEGLFKIKIYQKFMLPIDSVYCYGERLLSRDKPAIAAIIILSIFGCLIFVGTVYDVFKANNCFNSKIYRCPEKHYALNLLTITQPISQVHIISVLATDGDIKPDVKGKCEIQPDDNRKSEIKPDVNGKSEIKPDANGKGEIKPDANEESEIKPDVNGKSEIKSDVNGESEIKPDVNGESEIKPDVNGEVPLLARIALCFSLYTNVPKLLNAKSTSGSITCIHGIRFLSLTWVVLGHTYNYGVISQDETFTTGNLLDFVPIMQRFTYQAVIGGGFAVDTFFVLSASLLTWLQLRDIARMKKKFTLSYGILYYFHRFWRLTPIYMFVLMAFGCLYQYLGSGPFWPSTISVAEHCKTVWWTNLLYINNLVKVDTQCMGWTWYLANDMQFYVISPILLAFMYMKPRIGVISTILLMVTGIAITIWKEYVINGNFFTMKSDGGGYWNNVYTVPWCRVSVWAVGMLLGFIFYKRDGKPFKNLILSWIGWFVAATTALLIVYMPYTENKEHGTEWTPTQRAFYEAVGRPAWGACIAWVIFACYSGMGGVINSILSWNGFIPLSRLTYAAYLVHPICMMVYVFSKRVPLHVNDYNIVYLFLGHLCVTYMVAFVCSLAFEAPAMALEKILLLKRSH